MSNAGAIMNARVVFDLDGTLIDSAPDIHAIANRLLAPHGAQISLAQTHMFIGNGVSDFVSRMLKAVKLPDTLHEYILDQFKSAYLTAVHHTRTYEGVLAALATLKSTDHRLGICTNKLIAPCMAVLDHLDLTAFFETVWGGDSLPTHKPDPGLLYAALRELGEGPCIYVGDSEVDAETAQAAGVPFLLYTEGYRKTAVEEIPHTAAFGNYSELPALITRYAVSQ